MATITVTGTITKGYPNPSLDIEIYANGSLLKKKSWVSIAKGQTVSDSTELTEIGNYDIFAKAKLSNALATVEAESPHKAVNVVPSSSPLPGFSIPQSVAYNAISFVLGPPDYWTDQAAINPYAALYRARIIASNTGVPCPLEGYPDDQRTNKALLGAAGITNPAIYAKVA